MPARERTLKIPLLPEEVIFGNVQRKGLQWRPKTKFIVSLLRRGLGWSLVSHSIESAQKWNYTVIYNVYIINILGQMYAGTWEAYHAGFFACRFFLQIDDQLSVSWHIFNVLLIILTRYLHQQPWQTASSTPTDKTSKSPCGCQVAKYAIPALLHVTSRIRACTQSVAAEGCNPVTRFFLTCYITYVKSQKEV